ncbi:MAG: recombinase family protein [Eubacteriales bacterium]|nr:recombinase family protein [Eubacteriales bacterium]
MKRVRMLLRVSSSQQLDTDGDLSIQRQILKDFIKKQSDWELDPKEYFEGSKSAYKNTSKQREVLQEILKDAQHKEFDILVPYKDDRVGRLMWDTALYVMSLKRFGVDIYTVKDGCITPESDDIMGQMMLTLRYANAQKSSADTGMRVKDTAIRLVQNGKFMGGRAPYGYRLEYSGEISKHGRALKHLVIEPEQAEIVKKIFLLAYTKAYGSFKIAKVLNENPYYKQKAPNDYWRAGTITSILTNPIYAGYTAYKRRERKNNSCHRLQPEDWIYSTTVNESLVMIDFDIWNAVQKQRKQRNPQHLSEYITITSARSGNYRLILDDILYCDDCNQKMVNANKYNYWTIKSTGEKRKSIYRIYQCQAVKQGDVSHSNSFVYATKIENIVLEESITYIGQLLKHDKIETFIYQSQKEKRNRLEHELRNYKLELSEIQANINIIEKNILKAMRGNTMLSYTELIELLHKQNDLLETHQNLIKDKKEELEVLAEYIKKQNNTCSSLPSWKDIFLNLDSDTQSVLIRKMIHRIYIKGNHIRIQFKTVSLNTME